MLCIIPISACTIVISSSHRLRHSPPFFFLRIWKFFNDSIIHRHAWKQVEIEERRAGTLVVVVVWSLFSEMRSPRIAVGHWNVHKWSCRMSSKYQVVDAVRSIKIFLGVLFYNRPLQPEKGSKWNWVKSKLVLREVSCLLGWAHNNLEHKINFFL